MIARVQDWFSKVSLCAVSFYTNISGAVTIRFTSKYSGLHNLDDILACRCTSWLVAGFVLCRALVGFISFFFWGV